MCAFLLSDEERQWVDSQLKSMSLKQKVGQLFCPMMMENEVTEEEQLKLFAERVYNEVETFAPGGYYLNRYYLPTTSTMVNVLQEQSKIPMLIGADMEYGAGSGLGGVIAPGLTTFPPPMGLGAAGFEQYAYQVGKYTAIQASSIGVNYIFGPSLDVNNNPENPIINIRSYGENPEMVAALGSAFIIGAQEEGVITSAKHFPGHGDTSEDSHLLLSKILGDRQRLDEVELYPFKKAIEESGVYSIMTGHLAVPTLEPDPKCPATLSKIILQDILRGELGFQGLIITDAMLMGGITTLYDQGEAAVRAINAGCDIILMPSDLEKAWKSVYQAVEQGVITEERLDESVQRILELKTLAGLTHYQPTHIEAHDLEETAIAASKVSHNICRDAITLVKNEENLLPLREEDLISVIHLTDSPSVFDDEGISLFGEISERQMQAEFSSLTPDSDDTLFEQANELINQTDIIIISASVQVLPSKDTVELPEKLSQIIDYALGQDKKVILVSFGNPYLIQRYAGCHAYLCAWHYFDEMTSTVADVLFGTCQPHGYLPVEIPDIADCGTGFTL